jgi:hypothetical protein
MVNFFLKVVESIDGLCTEAVLTEDVCLRVILATVEFAEAGLNELTDNLMLRKRFLGVKAALSGRSKNVVDNLEALSGGDESSHSVLVHLNNLLYL